MKQTNIAIIGAGPIGLALAAKLTLLKIDFVIFEKGKSVGANLLDWGHVQLFTSWNENIDKDAKVLLNENEIFLPESNEFPTGSDLVRSYLRPLSSTPNISSRLKLNTEVTSIFFNEKKEGSFFELSYGNEATQGILQSKIVVDASGTWGNFNQVVSEENLRCFSKDILLGIPDLQKDNDYLNKNVVVVGSGHSAMSSLRNLIQQNTKKIHWIIRRDAPKFGKSKVGGKSRNLEGEIEEMVKSGKIKLHTNFHLNQIKREENKIVLVSKSNKTIKEVDKIVINAGAFPDFSMVTNFDLELDATFLCPKNLPERINPELHTCNSVSYNFEHLKISNQNYYVVGMKSFGKASNFLLSSGYEILDELIEEILDFKN